MIKAVDIETMESDLIALTNTIQTDIKYLRELRDYKLQLLDEEVLKYKMETMGIYDRITKEQKKKIKENMTILNEKRTKIITLNDLDEEKLHRLLDDTRVKFNMKKTIFYNY
jgi:hypothetical protein